MTEIQQIPIVDNFFFFQISMSKMLIKNLNVLKILLNTTN